MELNKGQDNRSQQIDELLSQVDRLIESGSYDVALDLIRRAQALDTDNNHARAFVGRIQKLMAARKAGASGAKGASQFAPPSSKAPRPPTGPSGKQSQENTAQIGSQRQGSGESRKAGLRQAIEGILARAGEYRRAGNFDRALAEIERARLLDPSDERIDTLGSEIRAEMEEVRAKMSEEQLRRQQEEDERKKELLEQEIERISREKEEKRKREEEARKEAQQQRLQHYLKSAEDLIGSGRLDEAANQLAFVVVIDPLNAAAAELQRRIREIHEKKRQEEIELRRRKEEEELQRQTAVRAATQKNVEAAQAFAAQKKFNEALRVITRAYMLDPLNEEVRACEQRVLEAQEEALRAAEEERRAAEEAERRRQEEELRRLTEAERARLLKEQEAALQQEKKALKEQVARHLARAREHIGNKSYHDALAEVAQAFAVDPFDEEVRQLEQEVMSAQQKEEEEAAKQAAAAGEQAREADDVEGKIKEHLEAAQRFRASGEHARALDELTKAFVLDPLNQAVLALQSEIDGEAGGAPPPPVTPPAKKEHPPAGAKARETPAPHAEAPPAKPANPNRVAYHAIRARKLLENGNYEDALAEVALGLTLDRDNTELHDIESAIWELQNAASAQDPNGVTRDENRRLIQIHLAAAEQFQAKGDFKRALDEIAKAYQVDPLNPEIKQRENMIRQEELRREHPAETPLKLVYPKKGAAGGS